MQKFRWATQRKVFGKPLINQAVVRAKIAGMIQRAEAIQAWLENVTYQMCNMAYKEQAEKLAGYVLLRHLIFRLLRSLLLSSSQIAFLKSFSTQAARQTAQDAVQIFGGRGITQTGMGRFIEHVRRYLYFLYSSLVPSSRSDTLPPRIVSPHGSVRRVIGWCRRCPCRPRCTAGNALDAERCEVVMYVDLLFSQCAARDTACCIQSTPSSSGKFLALVWP